MSDDSSHLTWYDDLPVREIQENIANLDDDPRERDRGFLPTSDHKNSPGG